jgi:hypothetical protein
MAESGGGRRGGGRALSVQEIGGFCRSAWRVTGSAAASNVGSQRLSLRGGRRAWLHMRFDVNSSSVSRQSLAGAQQQARSAGQQHAPRSALSTGASTKSTSNNRPMMEVMA